MMDNRDDVVSMNSLREGPRSEASRNPALIGLLAAGALYKNPTLAIGVVTRAGGGSYDIEVSILPSMRPLMCTMARSTAASLIGVSECDIPPEGSQVIVLMPTNNNQAGVILNCYPDANRGVMDKNLHDSASLIDLEGHSSIVTERTSQVPQSDKVYTGTIDAASGRFLDNIPGNHSWFNEQGVAISILNLILLLKATDRARLEFGVLDDLVRLISGYFQHISSQGTEQIYNDGGFITRELGVSIYQWEHSGFLKLGTQAFKENGDGKFLKDSTTTRYDFSSSEPPVPRKRLQCFTGVLGDIMNIFVANPDPAIDVDTVSQKAKDQGLMHAHVDTSGRVTLRSAAGISLQRADHIPVPKRLKEPWDPSGDKAENANGAIPVGKPPYAFGDPRARSSLLRDASAYRNAQAYSKLHRHSTSVNSKDIYLPEEKEMLAPDNTYDPSAKGSENFKDNAYKSSYFNLEDDGSIIIRDAWGSEIIMRGGNIIISCAGQIELRSGKNIVQLAGHDVVAKARNSIDITATNKDVRIKADGNMQLLSEGRSGGGGILIESKSTGEAAPSGTGESAVSTGIVLKAADSRILSTANTVHMAATNAIIVDGMDDAGTPVANMAIGVRQFTCAASRYVSVSAGAGAGLLITPHLAVVAGGTAILAANSSARVLEGTQAWIPFQKADMITNFYNDCAARIRDVKGMLLDDIAWLGSYPPAVRADIGFSYRSSEEYGTDAATEVEGSTGFAVYQPAWAFMAGTNSPFVPVTLTAWKEYAIDGTYPWPGKTAYDAKSYVKVKAEEYILDARMGVAKDRQTVLTGGGKPGSMESVEFNEYEVVL